MRLTEGRTERIRGGFLEAIREEIQDAQTARNLIHLIREFDPDEIERLAACLEDGKGQIGQTVAQNLSMLQRDRISRSLKSGRRTVAVYFPTAAYREHVAGLRPRLREAGYNVITVLGMVCDDRYEQDSNTHFGGHCGSIELVNTWDFVDLFITPVLATDLPASARKVYVLHDIHDSPLGDEQTTLEISRKLQEYDYIYAPSPPVVEMFRRVVPLANPTNGVRKPVSIIPGGYMKLDRFIDYFEAHRQEAKSLIYAPTVTGYGLDDVGSVVRHGEQIVGALLEAAPDHELIFRPHPHSLTHPAVQAIIHTHRDNPRFTLDDDASFYMDSYSRARLMVSDISGTAFTYAFGTLRPVVFCSFSETLVQERYGHLRYVRDRKRIGRIVEDVEGLVRDVQTILGSMTGAAVDVRDYRDEAIYNVGKAEDYFVEHFTDMLEGRLLPEWVVA